MTEEKQTTKTHDPKLNLFQRLLRVSEEVGKIHKGGYNSHSKYNYVSEADVSNQFREAFLKYGVYCSVSTVDENFLQTQTKSGTAQVYAMVTSEFTFVNVDKPEEKHIIRSKGHGVDTGDKGIYKAMTGAVKYGLLKSFCIGTDDDLSLIHI